MYYVIVYTYLHFLVPAMKHECSRRWSHWRGAWVVVYTAHTWHRVVVVDV